MPGPRSRASTWRTDWCPCVLVRALNVRLPDDVRVVAVAEAGPASTRAATRGQGLPLHHRESARIPAPSSAAWSGTSPQRLDVDGMTRAAAMLVGEHDFAAFQASGGDVQTLGPAPAAVPRSYRTRRCRPRSFAIRSTGTGFLRHMVRNIVGTLVDIGKGRWPAEEMARILASRSRHRAGATAPAQGLVLCGSSSEPSNPTATTVGTRRVEPSSEPHEPQNRLKSHPTHVARSAPGVDSARLGGPRTRPADSGRPPAAARRHHHGRQRPMGGRRHLPRVEGHRAGIQSVRDVARNVRAAGPARADALRILGRELEASGGRSEHADDAPARYLRSELSTLLEHNIRFNVVGRIDGLAPDIQVELADAERRTAAQHGACTSTSRSTTAAVPRSSTPRARRSRRASHPNARRSSLRRVPLHRRPARSGPADPHQRRDARQQLPAVADRVRGDLRHRNATGPTSAGAICSRPSWPTRSATGATAASRRRWRPA